MTQAYRITIGFLIFFAVEALLMIYIDRPLSEYLRTVDTQHPDLIDCFRFYTDLGKSKWYLWPSGLAAIFCTLALRFAKLKPKTKQRLIHLRNVLLFFFLCLAVSGLLTDAIKYFVGRARPVELERDNFYGFHPMMPGSAWRSWPSGHSTTAFALAFSLIALLPRWRMLWLTLAVVLALSRVMVNAHYLSDTIAGAMVGILTVYGINELFNRNGINHIKQSIFPIDK